MIVEEKVRQVVEEAIVDDQSLFLVGVKLKGNPGNQKLMVWLDGDEGVSIEQCILVNRKLSQVLDEEDWIDGKYHLEVSSAGLDHPLQLLRQYQKNIGRTLKVMMKEGKEVKGKLLKVDENEITLLVAEKKSEKEVIINFNDVEQSLVTVSFK